MTTTTHVLAFLTGGFLVASYMLLTSDLRGHNAQFTQTHPMVIPSQTPSSPVSSVRLEALQAQLAYYKQETTTLLRDTASKDAALTRRQEALASKEQAKIGTSSREQAVASREQAHGVTRRQLEERLGQAEEHRKQAEAGRKVAEAKQKQAEETLASHIARLAVQPSLASPSPATASEPPRLWLRLAMNSVGRPGMADYISPTLAALVEQLDMSAKDETLPLYRRVEAVIFNCQPATPHPVFRKAQERWQGHPLLRFQDLHSTLTEKAASKVQQQTLDLVAIIQQLQERTPSRFILFVEDDFVLCRNGLLAIQYALQRTSTTHHGQWAALRTSYGFNGIIIRMEDLPSLALHLRQLYTQGPPDLLFAEWFRKQRPRPLVAFRHNLFYHVGLKSAISNDADRFIPRCYELLFDWLQHDELFRVEECAHEDIWPCKTEQEVLLQGVGRQLDATVDCDIAVKDSPMPWTSDRFRMCIKLIPRGVQAKV